MYYLVPKDDTICHFGVKRRSGRYPYGSGERPYQDREKTFSYRVGAKRLENRRNVLSTENDRFAAKVGLSNNMKSVNVEQLNQQTRDILAEPERVQYIGRKTIGMRAGAWSAASAATIGLAAISAMALDTITFGAAAGLVPLGMAYIYHRKTTY